MICRLGLKGGFLGGRRFTRATTQSLIYHFDQCFKLLVVPNHKLAGFNPKFVAQIGISESPVDPQNLTWDHIKGPTNLLFKAQFFIPIPKNR